MSLLPMFERVDVTQGEGDKYDVNGVCAAPGCYELAIDKHHLWRRSAGFNCWWVNVKGKPVPNIVGLCHDHHMQLDSSLGGQKAFIVVDRWFAGNRQVVFYWLTRAQAERMRDRIGDPGWYDMAPYYGAPMYPQPGPTNSTAMQLTVDGDEVPHEHVANGDKKNEKPCPKCHGKGRITEEKQELPQAPARPKATWSVRVPKDERENGYEVLTGAMEAAVAHAAVLGLIRDENKSANYYTLLAALYKFAKGENE